MNKNLKEIPKEMHFKCLVCDKKIELDPYVSHHTFATPPMDGVSFTTYGNYGSAVYDLQQRTEAVVCDQCFVKKAGNMMTYKVEQSQLPETERDFAYVSMIVKQPSWKNRLRNWMMNFLPPFARRYYR